MTLRDGKHLTVSIPPLIVFTFDDRRLGSIGCQNGTHIQLKITDNQDYTH